MKLLIDTHVLIWAADDIARVATKARSLMSDVNNELLFSAASIWEVAIKSGLSRPDFSVIAHSLRRGLLDNGYTELPTVSEHVVAIDALPAIHKDPFDRVLIAQATVESVSLLTADATLAQYESAAVVYVGK